MLLTALWSKLHWKCLFPSPQQLKTVKLVIVALLLTGLAASARTYSQKVTISEKNVPIEKVFSIIEQQTGYVFFYDEALLAKARKVNIQAANLPLAEVLKLCFQDQPLTYAIVDETIIVKAKPQSAAIAAAPPPQDITGIVTDAEGQPLAGAAVKVKGTTQGAGTDRNGHFKIASVDDKATLEVSYIGYDTKLVPVNGGRSIAVQLTATVSDLGKTIVIGYGTTTKLKSTGSTSTLRAEDIAKQPIANPLNALQGRVAGALVTQSNGLPGSRVTIQIRGNNSIDASSLGSQPLYIIDGVPFNMNDNSLPFNNDVNGRGISASSGGLSPFSLINPSEIESIDILKDADATAIYGARGSNGVVLITTKKGKAGKTKLGITAYQGMGKVGHYIPMMNTQQYRQMRKEAFANDGTTPSLSTAPDLLAWDSTTTTDWQKRYMGNTAKLSDVQATVSGGDARTRFLLSTGYHYETPVFPGDYNNRRISSRFNADHTSLDRKFNANVTANYAYENTNLPYVDLSSLYILPPNMPLYNADGSLYWNANFNNPEATRLKKYGSKSHNLVTNAVLRYTILPGLDIKSSFGYNNIQMDQNQQEPAVSKNPTGSGTLTNSARFVFLNQRSYIWEPQATYSRNIGEGKLSALLGSTFQSSVNTALSQTADNYSTAALMNSLTGAGSYGTPTYSYTAYKYTSVFGRLTYDWKSKYLFNGVLRRDGSSRFGNDSRFGTFWSLGTGWVFSKEAFARSWSFLTFGKLRGSYGRTGNDQIQDYLYRAMYSSSGTYQNSTALVPSRIDNPLLHWQNTYKLEFGLDLAFLDSRVEATASYYTNRTPDQLGYLTLSDQAGFNSYASNFDAVIRNSGVEFELKTDNIRKKNFGWKTAFNLTIPRTNLVSASPSYFYYNRNLLGKPLSMVLRYNYMGVDPSTGRPLYRDATKDSLTFTPNFSTDRSMAGYTAPKMYGGINNTFNYKGFELSFFFQYTVQDGTIYPLNAPGVFSNGNQQTYWLNRWTKPGDNSALPKATTTSSVYGSWSSSNATWGNASFLRLRNVNMSYAFPAELLKKMHVENCRVFLQGQNLWWTSKNKYSYDPETGTSMPPLRIITAGLNVTF